MVALLRICDAHRVQSPMIIGIDIDDVSVLLDGLVRLTVNAVGITEIHVINAFFRFKLDGPLKVLYRVFVFVSQSINDSQTVIGWRLPVIDLLRILAIVNCIIEMSRLPACVR